MKSCVNQRFSNPYSSESPGRLFKPDCWVPHPEFLIQYIWLEADNPRFYCNKLVGTAHGAGLEEGVGLRTIRVNSRVLSACQ